jgi:hypothetical protein
MFTLALIVFSAVLLALVLAAFRPDNFRISRSLEINAPAARIFPLIMDFTRWAEWSPYEKLDPAMKRQIGETNRGKGATYGWSGNNKVGEGSMTISEVRLDSLVAIDLSIKRPMKAENEVNFTLEPSSHGTLVTWQMDGRQSYVGKLMGLFMNVDRMVGSQFEQGLASLKLIAERN